MLTSMNDACFTTISDQLDIIIDLANNYSTMDDTMQDSTSEEVKGIIEHLATVANTKLGNTYIFGGEQADSVPFQLKRIIPLHIP